MTVIIDTNVILVANGKHDDASFDCVAACARRLESAMTNDRIALDEGFEILREYQNKIQPKKGNGPGDAFVKWALRNKANPKHCDLVRLQTHPIRGYESFPDDERLVNFDTSDKKFVAVAAAHDEQPPIAQAVDSKWVDWEKALADYGITVEFVCPADIHRFHTKKFGK